MDIFLAERLDDLVAKLPTQRESGATAAKQDNNHNADDERSVIFLRGFGGNRHFVHDFFSL